MRNVHFKISFLLVISLTCAGLAFGAQTPAQKQPATAQTEASDAASTTAMNSIIDRMIARETALIARMRASHPLVETYLQNLDKDDALAFRPT